MFSILRTTALHNNPAPRRVVAAGKMPIRRFNELELVDLYADSEGCLEGLFGDSLEEKIAKYRKKWNEHRQQIHDHLTEVVFPDIRARHTRISEDFVRFEKKLKNTSDAELKDIKLVSSLTHLDTVSGMKAISDFDEFYKHILSHSPATVESDLTGFYKNIRSKVPPSFNHYFEVYFDKDDGVLVFDPSYLYRDGLTIHKDKSLSELGYTKDKLLELLPDSMRCMEAGTKLIDLYSAFERKIKDYEDYGLSLIRSGKKHEDVVNDLYWTIYNFFYACYRDMLKWSVGSYSGLAASTLVHVCSHI